MSLFLCLLIFESIFVLNLSVSDVYKENEDEAKVSKMFNFASHTAGAVILDHSPSSAKGFNNLLSSDKDKYGISSCHENKWVVIGLSEDILVTSVAIANYEKYSSMLQDFQLMAATSYPTEEWFDLGNFTAQPKLGEQLFNVTTQTHTRYLKFNFLTHYLDEALCTLSQIKVYGMTVIASLQHEVEMSDTQMRDMLQNLNEDEINIETEIEIEKVNGLGEISEELFDQDIDNSNEIPEISDGFITNSNIKASIVDNAVFISNDFNDDKNQGSFEKTENLVEKKDPQNVLDASNVLEQLNIEKQSDGEKEHQVEVEVGNDFVEKKEINRMEDSAKNDLESSVNQDEMINDDEKKTEKIETVLKTEEIIIVEEKHEKIEIEGNKDIKTNDLKTNEKDRKENITNEVKIEKLENNNTGTQEYFQSAVNAMKDFISTPLSKLNPSINNNNNDNIDNEEIDSNSINKENIKENEKKEENTDNDDIFIKPTETVNIPILSDKIELTLEGETPDELKNMEIPHNSSNTIITHKKMDSIPSYKSKNMNKRFLKQCSKNLEMTLAGEELDISFETICLSPQYEEFLHFNESTDNNLSKKFQNRIINSTSFKNYVKEKERQLFDKSQVEIEVKDLEVEVKVKDVEVEGKHYSEEEKECNHDMKIFYDFSNSSIFEIQKGPQSFPLKKVPKNITEEIKYPSENQINPNSPTQEEEKDDKNQKNVESTIKTTTSVTEIKSTIIQNETKIISNETQPISNNPKPKTQIKIENPISANIAHSKLPSVTNSQIHTFSHSNTGKELPEASSGGLETGLNSFTTSTPQLAIQCFDALKFSEFQKKMMLKLQLKSNASASGNDTLNTSSMKENNVFKVLMQKIKALEMNNAIVEMYSIQLSDCYRSVTKDLLERVQALEFSETYDGDDFDDFVKNTQNRQKGKLGKFMKNRSISKYLSLHTIKTDLRKIRKLLKLSRNLISSYISNEILFFGFSTIEREECKGLNTDCVGFKIHEWSELMSDIIDEHLYLIIFSLMVLSFLYFVVSIILFSFFCLHYFKAKR